MFGERNVLLSVNSAPGSPSGTAAPSPKRAGLGTGYLHGYGGSGGGYPSGGPPASAPSNGGGLNSSAAQQQANSSQFQVSHENTLRKNRNHYIGQAQQYSIDYHAAHNKAHAELPVLQEQHLLEVDEYQNALEDVVARHVARIAQLRQDYGLLAKDASRRHMELQQRRFAGARVEMPSIPPSVPAPLPPITPTTTAAPNGTRASIATAAAEQAHSHSVGQVHPNAYLKTLDNGASAAISTFATRPPNTALGVGTLSLSTPPSPTGRLPASAPSGEGIVRPSDFGRLEAMHDKFMGRTRSLHEQGLSSRAAEVNAWSQTFAACMAALASHQQSALAHLATCVEEAEAWHAQQRLGLAAAHEEVMVDGDRLGRALEATQANGAAKLHGLLASFLERVLPSGEVGLAEAQAAYTRAAANLRNEHMAALESLEASLRALVPRHAAMRQHMTAAYSAGLAAHEASLAAAGAQYDSRALPELRRQYEEAEAKHRDALASIRVEHLKGLAASKEGWIGEAAALLEEYRARMQELRAQFFLTYDVDVTEV